MAIEARIEKRLGDFRLAVDIRAGDGCLGVLGASGSGKSMILKCIAGIEAPDAGRIAVNGRTLFDSSAGVDVPPQRRRVGYLFQNYALFPHMTVEENIAVGVARSGRERGGLVGRLVERFRLAGMEKRYPDQISGGQQQRVAVARLLAAEPEAILLDEPFSALDPHLREAMQLGMLDVIRDCRDVIMVTHSRDEAYRMCDELAVLDDGAVLRRGRTAEVFADPGRLLAARVTGCKNISRAEKLSARLVRAVDWGLTLRAAAEVPDGTTHVGIRAHDFQPADAPGPDADNLVRMRIVRRAGDLFEWNVIFTNADADVGEPAGRGELWWKYGKYAAFPFPSHLRLPPGALLFLRE